MFLRSCASTGRRLRLKLCRSTRCGKQDVVSPWTRPNSLLGLGPLQDRTTSLIASTARASKTPPGLVHRTDLLGPEYGFGNDFVLLDETYLGAYGRVCHQYQILEPTAGASAPRRLTPWPNNPPTPRLMPSTPCAPWPTCPCTRSSTRDRRRRRDELLTNYCVAVRPASRDSLV